MIVGVKFTAYIFSMDFSFIEKKNCHVLLSSSIMDSRKRKPPTASSSTPTKKRTANERGDAQDVKLIKVSNRRAGPGAFTIVATPRARIGDIGVIDGVRYVVRSEQELRSLIRQRKWNEVERTCTSYITNMSSMFYGARGFNRPIGAWDTSRVTDMSGMFSGARVFNHPVGGWDTSRVTAMSGMFYGALTFNHPLNRWDTSRVRSMSAMFENTDSFNQPVASWNVSRVVDMSAMFENAHSFNQPVAAWNVSRVVDIENMFTGASSFRQDLSAWAKRLPRNVWIDRQTRSLIGPLSPPPDPRVAAFRARRYRLHPEANAIDPVLLDRVNLDDAVVIAGDLHGDSKLRHIFSRATTDGIFRSKQWIKKSGRNFQVRSGFSGPGGIIFRYRREPKHPVTGTPIHPDQVVPLRDVLHANDAAIYNRVGTPAGTVQARTVKQVRDSNARNARNARNVRNARNP